MSDETPRSPDAYRRRADQLEEEALSDPAAALVEAVAAIRELAGWKAEAMMVARSWHTEVVDVIYANEDPVRLLGQDVKTVAGDRIRRFYSMSDDVRALRGEVAEVRAVHERGPRPG
ncbi:MAG: hypothetical protein AAGA90_21745 [Actinomycetota bacterium]